VSKLDEQITAQRKLVDDLAAEHERALEVVRVSGEKLATAQNVLTKLLEKKANADKKK